MSPDNRNIHAEHNSAFHADAATVIHGKGSVVIDFKQTSPRVDQVENATQHTVITEHNAVVMRPQMAKVLLNILEENVSNYENKFGEIELPEQPESVDSGSEDAHGYIG